MTNAKGSEIYIAKIRILHLCTKCALFLLKLLRKSALRGALEAHHSHIAKHGVWPTAHPMKSNVAPSQSFCSRQNTFGHNIGPPKQSEGWSTRKEGYQTSKAISHKTSR